ncbi:hypothetical protein BGW38_007186 [Lunasporangiospora selenospora]|uniref:C2H2-type domain-containing protein n=1 Tax=Lunasporangiospora selenospora TaxID=979761 RepID=A0A9P6KIJ0_9FUNG|nr:hypothetical protein BGW38_007186 [Lunasporangiospora selenospora]
MPHIPNIALPGLVLFDSDFTRPGSPYPGADGFQERELETAFCRDFLCCGLRLVDLHDLLQHYEECHVRFEEDDELGDGDSEFLDDDSWSDSDSDPSSPSSFSVRSGAGPGATPLFSDVDSVGIYPNPLLQGFARTNSSSYFQAPPLPHYPSLHPAHPLYQYYHGAGNSECSSDLDSSLPFNSTANFLEAFTASFGGPNKRKANVSLADIYAEDEDDTSMRHPAFPFSTAHSHTIGSTGVAVSDMMRPPSKRQALEMGQHVSLGSVIPERLALQRHEKMGCEPGPLSFKGPGACSQLDPSVNPSIFPGLAGRFMPFGPLSNRTTLLGGANPAMLASPVDLLRHREEVFSLMEDITKCGNTNASDKPYRCSVLGCDKAYKNPNGLKYHNLHGHSSSGMCDADSPESKPYVCTFLECGKRYKNLNGLKYHIEHSHPNLTAALRAHQSGLINPHIFGPYPKQAAMTIAAALAAVQASPMMMAAANAILTAQAINASNNANANATGNAPGDNNGSAERAGARPGPGPGPGPMPSSAPEATGKPGPEPGCRNVPLPMQKPDSALLQLPPHEGGATTVIDPANGANNGVTSPNPVSAPFIPSAEPITVDTTTNNTAAMTNGTDETASRRSTRTTTMAAAPNTRSRSNPQQARQ